MHNFLNMLKFWLWQSSEYGRVLNMRPLRSAMNMPEYALTEFLICLGFKMYQGSEYARVTQGSKYAKIWLYMCHTIYSARSLNKLMSTYWEVGFSEPGQRSKMEPFGKIILVLNYFYEKLHPKSLRGFFIYVGFSKYHSSEYSSIFVVMTRLWVCAGM